MKKVLYLNIVLMILYTMSIQRPWVYLGKKVSIVLVAFYLLMLAGIPYLTYRSKKVAGFVDYIFNTISSAFRYLYDNWKKTLLGIGVYAALAIISVLICIIQAAQAGTYFNMVYMFLLIGISYMIATAFFLRKSINEKPERLFFSVLMIAGVSFILAMPNNLGASWDDGVHFYRTESILQYSNAEGMASDNLEIENEIHFFQFLTKDQRIENDSTLNQYETEVPITPYQYNFFSIAYIPYAVGMAIGRALFMPFTWAFKLAKIVNLAFYGMLISMAMKKLKFGKILVAAIGLIPTVVFMASNFAYDQWVIGFTIYGFCYFFSFLQDREKKMTGADEWIMLGSFVVGILPKAIYFIVMLPLFFMPKTAFADRKQHQKYILYVFLSGLFLAATFLLPMIIAGAGSGDVRGGSDVNATEQIRFILTNPSQYLDILLNFLGNYLRLDNAGHYMQDFAYLGLGQFMHITPAIVGTVALLDKGGTKSKNRVLCLSSYIGCFLAIALSATALYISYTSVGSLDIAGCQFRYIIPVLFPFLYMLMPDSIENHTNRLWFNSLPMLFMGITFLYNTLTVIAKLY
jgi:uncharacterized membrane protein